MLALDMAIRKGLRGRFRGMTARDHEPAGVSPPHISELTHFATQCRYLTAAPADSLQLQSPLTVMHFLEPLPMRPCP